MSNLKLKMQCGLALNLSEVAFILLINVKMPALAGFFNIYEQGKSCSVELSRKKIYSLVLP